jgi:putative Mg2+ transporter-C (MgtC) family protein
MVSDPELIGRLLLAAALGFVIGLERRITGHEAGERTFALVAMGSCLFTMAGLEIAGDRSPGRVASGVVAGVGFLGAGLIFQREGGGVRGLTTAAGLWVAAAAGVAVGVGSYAVAAVAAGVALLLLLSDVILKPLLGSRRGRGGRAPPGP